MKKLFILSLVLLGLASCKSSQVAVTSANGQGQGTGQGQVLEQANKKAAQKNSPATPESSSADSIFFNSFSFFDNHRVAATGIGFLSETSDTSSAYVFQYAHDAKTVLNESLIPWTDGVMFAKSVSGTQDAISFTRVPDLESKNIYTHSARITSLVRSSDKKWLGWTDDKGAVSLWHDSTRKVSPIDLPNFRASGLQIISGANRVVIVGNNVKNPNNTTPEVLIYSLSEQPSGIAEIPALDGQMSADGTWIALTQNDDSKNTLLLTNLQNTDLTFQLAQGPKGQSFQPKWSGSDLLAFIIPKSATEGELRVASMSAKTSSLVGQILSPYPLNKIVCPSWRGTTLYYGSLADNHLSILRARRRSGKIWSSKVFAQPTLEQDGYGCPNAERN